jgi:hypothetical protein
MLVAVWIALAVLGAAFAGGVTFAALRGLAAFRMVGAAGGDLADGVDRVTRDAEQVVTKLERLAGGSARLERALAGLRVSRARLNVLLEALSQVRAGLGRLTGVVPRKG